MNKPKWEHDCPKCEYLGTLLDVDCYHCGDTLVLRTGNDGPDYSSFPKLAIKIYESQNLLLPITYLGLAIWGFIKEREDEQNGAQGDQVSSVQKPTSGS